MTKEEELIALLENEYGYKAIYKSKNHALNDMSDMDIEDEFYHRDLECDCEYAAYVIGDVLEEDLDLEPKDIELALKLIGEVKLGGEEWLLTEKLRYILRLF